MKLYIDINDVTISVMCSLEDIRVLYTSIDDRYAFRKWKM